jgi:hypothetical protein
MHWMQKLKLLSVSKREIMRLAFRLEMNFPIELSSTSLINHVLSSIFMKKLAIALRHQYS